LRRRSIRFGRSIDLEHVARHFIHAAVDAAADQIRKRDTREGLLDDSGDLLPRLSHGAAGFVFASRRA
jgi:hypothetical protein